MRNASKNCSKRKGGKSSKTLADINGEAQGEGEGEGGKGFYACYLLASLSPRHKGHTYIGFTVNPKRRIRQHNGEITSGATRTKKKRPWEMTLCIYGFPTQVAALQFEWAWQHPAESLAVRKAACNLKSVAGLANKIIVAFTMLTLHTWQSMDLTVNFFSTKYMTHVAACPSLPKQMKVQFGNMDDLPCYSSGNQPLHNDEDDWDLDPQECDSSDGIEDLTRRNSDEGIRPCFDASAYASSTENQADKESQQRQENDVLEPRDSFILKEDEKSVNTGHDQVQPSAERSPLPQESDVVQTRDSFFLMEDDDCQKHFKEVNCLDQECNTPMHVRAAASITIEDSGCNIVQPFKGVTDETQLSTIRQIEVIDLFTPSPDRRDNIHGKKRRVGSADTEVIDLTRSPDFIQL